MKIGILTYHRSHNYGALLQAIALRFILMKLGHVAYFIDYWPKYHKDIYRIYKRYRLRNISLLRRIKYLISTTISIPKIKKSQNRFNSFIEKYILPYTIKTTIPVDCIIYGSDQIWRKQPGLGNNKLNPVYFGEHDFVTSKHWSYAASMGKINLSDTDKHNIKKWLSKFDKISVRESDLKEAIEDCGLKNVDQVLDPTLLLNKNEWIKLLNLESQSSEKPYILFYDLLPDSFDINEIYKFAKLKRCDVKIIKGTVRSKHTQPNEIPFADPKEMVQLISNAEYVFTSSFHGLVFALIFNKEVYSAFSHNATRAESILSTLGILERLIEPQKTIPQLSQIDYSLVNARLQSLREESIVFIQK